MAWAIRLRDDEACAPTPYLSPDLLIVNAIGPELSFDMALAEPDERSNRGGLTAKRGLHTAVVIQIFSDRRLEDGMLPLDPLDPDPRGWWGDTVDLRRERGEVEIGSHLWTLRRAILTGETIAIAKEIVEVALQPIVDQGAVARFDVFCEGLNGGAVDQTSSILAIKVDGFGQDGSRRYSQRFEVLWEQVENLRRGTR